MASRSSPRFTAEESRLLDAWGRLGPHPVELKRICREILTRPRQGYVVAFAAQHIIASHVSWLLDAPTEAESSRENRTLLKTGPGVVRRLERALRDMIDLHRQAEKRLWYGKAIVAGEMQRRRDGSYIDSRRPWTRNTQIYARTLKALEADPLWQTLRETPRDMWLIPPRGNPKKRRNGALGKALRGARLTKVQIADVIDALDWTER